VIGRIICHKVKVCWIMQHCSLRFHVTVTAVLSWHGVNRFKPRRVRTTDNIFHKIFDALYYWTVGSGMGQWLGTSRHCPFSSPLSDWHIIRHFMWTWASFWPASCSAVCDTTRTRHLIKPDQKSIANPLSTSAALLQAVAGAALGRRRGGRCAIVDR